MGRPHDAVKLLKKGYSPSEIAQEWEITTNSVMGYLFRQVGEGANRRSDIVFSIDKRTRDALEQAIEKTGTTWEKRDNPPHQIVRGAMRVLMWLRKKGTDVNLDDARVYLRLRDARVSLGDMYELVRDIELYLHDRVIKDTLVRGCGESAWWREGVPVQIRKECVSRKEDDREPADDPFCYANLIHLKEILDKKWNYFKEILPPWASDKRKLLADLDKLNVIRNAVMHPVRMKPPSEGDFLFVREFAGKLGLPGTTAGT